MKMNMIYLSFFILMLYINPDALKAQSYFKEGETGIELTTVKTFHENGHQFTISPNLVIKGKVGLSLGLGWQNDISIYRKTRSIGGGISYLLMKQDHPSKPINLGVGASYTSNIKQEYDSPSVYAIGLGFDINRIYEIGKNFRMIPGASFGGNATKQNRFGGDHYMSYEPFAGLYLGLKMNYVVISPTYIFTNYFNFYGVGISLMTKKGV